MSVSRKRRLLPLLAAAAALASCSRIPVAPGPNAQDTPPSVESARAGRDHIGTTYYVSVSGHDEAAGTSPDTAWRTLRRANRATFGPGDRLLLEGGRRHSGMLQIRPPRCGATPERALEIGSYGSGAAIIDAGRATGIEVVNCGAIEIFGLKLVGEGAATSSGHGVLFYVDQPGPDLAHIVVDGVRVSGFEKGGITVGSWAKGRGFRGVSVVNSVVHHNGDHGIEIFGFFEPGYDHYSHERVRIAGNCAYHNQGDPDDQNRRHTGNGIVVGGVRNAIIEHNVAHHNGGRNVGGERDNGPVGIWAWHSDTVLMQFNHSHHNRSATRDGGGFDFDGGVSNSLMQYNYSNDNDGPGYLIAQWRGALPNRNNTIRYNISRNDGRKASQAGIMLWNGGDSIVGAHVYNNSVHVGGGAHARRAAFEAAGEGEWDVAVRNNLFFASDDTELIANVAGPGEIVFQSNAYVASHGKFTIRDGGETYASLADWRVARGHEWLDSRPTGVVSHAPPSGGTSGRGGAGASRESASSLARVADAALIDAGLDLFMHFGVHPGARDFRDHRVPSGAGFAIGALEHDANSAFGRTHTGVRPGHFAGHYGSWRSGLSCVQDVQSAAN